MIIFGLHLKHISQTLTQQEDQINTVGSKSSLSQHKKWLNDKIVKITGPTQLDELLYNVVNMKFHVCSVNQ